MTCDHLIKIAEELIASGRLVFRYKLQKRSFNYFQNPVDLFDITLGELTFFKNELFKDAQNSSRSKRHRGELSKYCAIYLIALYTFKISSNYRLSPTQYYLKINENLGRHSPWAMVQNSGTSTGLAKLITFISYWTRFILGGQFWSRAFSCHRSGNKNHEKHHEMP